MKKIIISFFVFSLVSFFMYVAYAHFGFLHLRQDRELITISLRQSFFSREERELVVELVKSPASVRQGLSDREALVSLDGQNIDGMLFLFEDRQVLSFWMKDMHFDIDICWIDGLHFLSCERNAPAPTEHDLAIASFSSETPVTMVLETLPAFLSDQDLKTKLFFK